MSFSVLFGYHCNTKKIEVHSSVGRVQVTSLSPLHRAGTKEMVVHSCLLSWPRAICHQTFATMFMECLLWARHNILGIGDSNGSKKKKKKNPRLEGCVWVCVDGGLCSARVRPRIDKHK